MSRRIPWPEAAPGALGFFYLFSFLSDFQLGLPLWVIYLTKYRGFSLTQINIMEAAFTLIMVAAQMPSGAFADRWGRVPSLRVSAALFSVGILLFGLANSYPLLLVSYVFWGTSGSFRFGAEQAFLYETLRSSNRQEEYQKVLGRVRAITLAAAVAATAIGPPIAAATSLQVPVLAGSIFGVLALIVSFRLVEPGDKPGPSSQGYSSIVLEGVGEVLRRPSVRWLVLMAAAIQTAFYPIMMLTQPFLAHHGVAVASFGLFLIPRQLLGVLAPLTAHKFSKWLGYGGVFTLRVAGVILAMSLLGTLDSLWAFPGFLVMSATFGLFEPVQSDYLNRRLSSERRATALSFERMLWSLTSAATLPAGGWLADHRGMRSAFAAAGALVTIVCLPMLALWRRADRREKALPPDLGASEALSGVEREPRKLG